MHFLLYFSIKTIEEKTIDTLEYDKYDNPIADNRELYKKYLQLWFL